ncbi:hypothetical protein [Pseudonocardia spinosispora]|uniref:hypothetical protein n=1 Tax=Pseudonocardia spinosispora TaxID=103441 RepID=UPI000428D9D3|nr:hypothetical protein [Pseudonocardia spinosispora]
MSDQIIAALDRGRNPRHLSAAAHEIGHAVAAMANGARPKRVWLNIGLFGGVLGGMCETNEMPSAQWPRRRQIGRLVSDLAGHAAETRFRQVYLGMSFKAAFTLARDVSDGDYHNFRDWRREFGLGREVTERWAFDQAHRLLVREGDYLDRYTVRLAREHRLSGSAL